jgi:tetratricopeptide (TPR) repeat protein
MNRALITAILTITMLQHLPAATPDPFASGCAAYANDDFALAARMFTESSSAEPAAGTFQNLGNAEWKNNRTAEAILAWERAALLNPLDRNAENNLKFARDAAQLESLDLTWCEIAASRLPANVWAWLACGSLWFAVATMMLPGVLRRRRSATQQALVAVGLGIFLLSLPANYGVWTRSQIGLVMKRETPLRLTPTAEGEAVTKLAAGEPGRVLRERGNHLLIRTRRTTGWVERDGFILIVPR